MSNNKFSNVRIINTSGVGYQTEIVDVKTGEPIKNFSSVEVTINPNQPVKALIEMICPAIDIIAYAEIKHICPCCGRDMPEDKQTS